MGDRLNEILEEIRELERSVQEEIRRKEEVFQYKIRKGRVIFARDAEQLQKTFSRTILRYLMGARLLNALTAPVIYAMAVPALIIDLCVSIYQTICFPIYRIPKVKRRDHIILDRHYLKYLNFLERVNCDYCSYFNGLASYMSEVAALTEQYWCPIKHAFGKARPHSRYHLFLDYGDAEGYRTKVQELRKKYDDLK